MNICRITYEMEGEDEWVKIESNLPSWGEERMALSRAAVAIAGLAKSQEDPQVTGGCQTSEGYWTQLLLPGTPSPAAERLMAALARSRSSTKMRGGSTRIRPTHTPKKS